MNTSEIRAKIETIIREIAAHGGRSLPELADESELVDGLGFSSLQVAALIANLEEAFGIDPFLDENVSITDIRTLGDLSRVYSRSLEARA